MNRSGAQRQLFSVESEGFVPSFGFTIIACPGCDTRFRVSSNVIDEVESPRFHCSRCDLVFNQSEIRSTLTPKPIQIEKPALDISREIHVEPSKTTKVVTPFEIPAALLRSVPIAPPHENEPQVEEQPKQLELKFPKPPRTSLFSKFSARTIGASSLKEEKVKIAKLPSQWSGTVSIATGVLLFLSLLASATLIISSSSGISSKAAAWIMPSETMIPDAEITISNPKFETMILDSGETVHIVSGEVTNNTTKPITSINVEGVLYNKNAEILGTGRGWLGSSLVRSRLENLNLETINELQATPPDVKSSLLPKNKLLPQAKGEFRIIVPHYTLSLSAEEEERSDALLEPVYFSARVYSVKQAKE